MLTATGHGNHMAFLRYVWQPATCQVTKFPDPLPATPSPPQNCTSPNSANWQLVSPRALLITVVADLCQAAKPLSRVS